MGKEVKRRMQVCCLDQSFCAETRSILGSGEGAAPMGRPRRTRMARTRHGTPESGGMDPRWRVRKPRYETRQDASGACGGRLARRQDRSQAIDGRLAWTQDRSRATSRRSS